ncbi:MAG: DUF5054 domain-containing protein [Clostridia bacterium]
MAKKVYIVSKTHLDLGFTDLAEKIRTRYISEFIPKAIEVAAALNTDGKKRFAWTIGSWILKEALKDGTPEEVAALEKAVQKGDIVSHAFPFTTHTELLDEDTLNYGLGIIKDLDARFGKNTVAAKMTDVPGHTKALVPILHRSGIKLLHIGVNDSSAVPKVPKTFLWKWGGGEVVVIYQGTYGETYTNEYIDDILYFAHTSDNLGPVSYDKALENYQRLEQQYPDYQIEASGLDEIAEKLWAIREKLPVLTEEIGDSWIHGAASDPYKAGALRELILLKNKWIKEGSLLKNSDEYITLADNILCLAEHTCGVDIKTYLGDYTHYLKQDFNKARLKDRVRINPLQIFKGYPHNFLTLKNRIKGIYKKGSYKMVEKSWREQRMYINKAVALLSPKHKEEALKHLSRLMPESHPQITGENIAYNHKYQIKDTTASINEYGALSLSYKGKAILTPPVDGSSLDYHSFTADDYDFWLTNYTRDIEKTYFWSVPDFARPLLHYTDGKFPAGRFKYRAVQGAATISEKDIVITMLLEIDRKIVEELGAPAKVYITYRIENGRVRFNLRWFDKDANRLTEALFLRMYPANSDIKYKKLGSEINPFNVVENGNRHLAAVESVGFAAEGTRVEIINRHSPLVSLGKGKILRFDNAYENVAQDGISFVLYNNVWGTNFPLWYSDNACFTTDIELI